ncbi:hypothetical protein V6Z11_D11G235100 [Gossypium hirsutum]
MAPSSLLSSTTLNKSKRVEISRFWYNLGAFFSSLSSQFPCTATMT